MKTLELLKSSKRNPKRTFMLPLHRPKLFQKGLVMKWSGRGRKACERRCFPWPASSSPSIHFIDEVDGFFKRTGGERESTRKMNDEFMVKNREGWKDNSGRCL